MKKTYIFVLLMMLFVSQLFSFHVFAADKKQELTLLEETFDDFDIQGQIYRHYQIVGSNQDVYVNIYLPNDIYEKVKNTENPLLEAKKELTLAYTHLKLEKRLSELNSVYLRDYPKAKVSVGYALQQTFNEQMDIANQYTNSQLNQIDKMSKKKQDALYKSKGFDYIDYGKEAKVIDKEYPENKEIEKLVKKENPEKDVQKVDDKHAKATFGYYVVIALILACVGVLTVFIFKKRG